MTWATLGDDPTCPYCQASMPDAFELQLADGECADVVCGACGAPYAVECRISVAYASSTMDGQPPATGAGG